MEESTESLTSRYADAILPFTVCLGIFMVIGILGNILVLCVFLPRPRDAKLRNNFRIFVINFAIVDLFVCAILFPTDMIRQRTEFNFQNEAMCAVKNYVNNYGATTSALSLLVISVERFRKVVHPMGSQMTKSLAFKLCLSLSTFSLIENVPVAVTSGIREINKTNVVGTQTLVYICDSKEYYDDHKLLQLFMQGFGIAVLAVVSIPSFVMYVWIMRTLYRRQHVTFSKGLTTKGSNSASAVGECRQLNLATNTLQTTENVDTCISDSADPCSALHQESHHLGNGGLNSHTDTRGDGNATTALTETKTSNYHWVTRNHEKMKTRYEKRFPTKTLIWFILFVIFIATNVLSLCTAIYMNHKSHFNQIDYALWTSFRKMYYVNSIINPFIYYLIDESFRDACKSTLKKMFPCY